MAVENEEVHQPPAAALEQVIAPPEEAVEFDQPLGSSSSESEAAQMLGRALPGVERGWYDENSDGFRQRKIPSLDELVRAQQSDFLCRKLQQLVTHGAGYHEQQEEKMVEHPADAARRGAAERLAHRLFGSKSSFFTMKPDGLLHRISVAGDQIVVPHSERARLLEILHGTYGGSGGHFAAAKTLAQILSRFWWPKVARDVEAYCTSCRTCAMVQASSQSGRRVFEKRSILRETQPGMVWHLDFIGPFPQAAGGMTYILVAVDEYSGFTGLLATTGTKSKHIISAVKQLIGEHGWMKGLRYDNGNGFGSAEWRRWLDEHHIKRWTIPPRAPQANGKVEIRNRSVKNVMTKVLAECTRAGVNWLSSLPATQLAINSAVTVAANNHYSPFELFMGRKVRTAVDNAVEMNNSAARAAEARDDIPEEQQEQRNVMDNLLLADSEVESDAEEIESFADEQAENSNVHHVHDGELDMSTMEGLNKLKREMVQRAGKEAVVKRRALMKAQQAKENEKLLRSVTEFNEGDAVWLLLRNKRKNDEAFVSTGNLQAPGQMRRVEAIVLERMGLGSTTYRVEYWIHRRGRGGPLKKTTTAKLEQLKRRVMFKTAEDKWKNG